MQPHPLCLPILVYHVSLVKATNSDEIVMLDAVNREEGSFIRERCRIGIPPWGINHHIIHVTIRQWSHDHRLHHLDRCPAQLFYNCRSPFFLAHRSHESTPQDWTVWSVESLLPDIDCPKQSQKPVAARSNDNKALHWFLYITISPNLSSHLWKRPFSTYWDSHSWTMLTQYKQANWESQQAWS